MRKSNDIYRPVSRWSVSSTYNRPDFFWYVDFKSAEYVPIRGRMWLWKHIARPCSYYDSYTMGRALFPWKISGLTYYFLQTKSLFSRDLYSPFTPRIRYIVAVVLIRLDPPRQTSYVNIRYFDNYVLKYPLFHILLVYQKFFFLR